MTIILDLKGFDAALFKRNADVRRARIQTVFQEFL